MPPICFARFCQCDPAQGGTMNSRSGEAIPCFAAEQGILSKPLGLLREMTVRPAKTVKKDQNQQISLFFSLYSGNPGLTPSPARRRRM
jgi:hypothetical protein